jgi:N-carbamoyl-L-amino-acid hydrolase
MRERQDALQGAALFITQAHERVREEYPEGVLNCGNLEVKPGARTIIPSEACALVELRHVNQVLLSKMESMIEELAHECAGACRVTVEVERNGHIPPATMAYAVIEAIEKACDQLGMTHIRLASYASHNAQMMSTITPSAMLFIPSVNGISHNPAEYSRWEDVVNGTNVLLHTILNLAHSP